MLEFFPTPYPKEWWYSVLCRYYIRSGIKEPRIVKQQLFGGDGGAYMGKVFPNRSIFQVLKRLPEGVFDIRDIILNHTPFLYYTRMYPTDERMEILDGLCKGENIPLTHLWKSFQKTMWSPRYCPECVREDTVAYGESYWHVDHQIPLMSVCLKHNCGLVQMEGNKQLDNRFSPLSAIEIQNEPMPVYPEWKRDISKIVDEYQRLPLSVGITRHNNLVQKLKNNGFYVVYRQGGISLNHDQLYTALLDFYGEETVRQVFGEKLDAGMVRRLIRWEQRLPDRYIYLQNMIAMKTEEVFSEEEMEDLLKSRMIQISKQGGFHTLKQVAEQMNMTKYEVSAVLRHYHMNPFWMSPIKNKYDKPRTGLLRCVVEEEELKEIERVGKELGYTYSGQFALECVRYVMKNEIDIG